MPLSLVLRSRKGNKRLSHSEMDTNLLNIENTINFFGFYDQYSDGSPGDDRVYGWDNSETSGSWLSLGNGLSISGTTIQIDGAVVAVLDSAPVFTGGIKGASIGANCAAGSNPTMYGQENDTTRWQIFSRSSSNDNMVIQAQTSGAEIELSRNGGTTVIKTAADSLEPGNANVDIGASQEFDEINCVNLTESSDGRKKEFKAASMGGNLLELLQPRQYVRKNETIIIEEPVPDALTWAEPYGRLVYREIEHTRTHHGLYAQEVRWALEQLGLDAGEYGLWVEKPNGDMALRYSQIVPILIQGWQELHALATVQAMRIDALEKRFEELEI